MRLLSLIIIALIFMSCGHNKIRYSSRKDFGQNEISQTQNSVLHTNDTISIDSKISVAETSASENEQTLDVDQLQFEEKIGKRVKSKTKSSERIRAEEIAEKWKQKLNLDGEEVAAKKQGSTLLIIGIVLFLLSMGLLVMVSEMNMGSDLGGCIEALFLIFIYGILLIGAGLTGLILVIMGIVVLSTGKAIGRRGRSRSQTNSQDRERERGYRTFSTIRIITSLVALVGVIIILATF